VNDADVIADEDVEELYEDAPCGFVSTAPDGTILRANRTFLALSGYDAAELVGRRRFYDLLPPGAKIYYETHYAPLLRMQGTVRELALELVRADGERIPVLVGATLKRDAAEEPALVRITVFDATDRRRYERELLQARSEADARAAAATALEHVAEAVVLVDDEGGIRVVNAAAQRLLGGSAKELRGVALSTVVPGWAEVSQHIPIGAGVAPALVPLGARWLSASGERAPEGVVYTLRDVTEERQLEELRDDIVAVVSHELRTPLAGVYGAAQTLAGLGDRLTDDARQQLLDVIGEQSERLRATVDEILLARHLATGQISAERRTFDVAAAAERVVARAEGRVSVRVVHGATAEGDAALFEQILANLLDNALTYSPRASEVRVAVEELPAVVRVTVADEGPGVAVEHRERIFDRFFRADPDQATGSGGIGLGLYVARELARRMRGDVGLVPSDVGATFYVELRRTVTP
jgi:PAS domain S-box-containing protein